MLYHHDKQLTSKKKMYKDESQKKLDSMIKEQCNEFIVQCSVNVI